MGYGKRSEFLSVLSLCSNKVTRFVEHFSPYCHHCKAFMPTWEKLVDKYENMPNPGIHLAQVNCAVHGGVAEVLFFFHP